MRMTGLTAQRREPRYYGQRTMTASNQAHNYIILLAHALAQPQIDRQTKNTQ